jgi:hypothetical protein
MLVMLVFDAKAILTRADVRFSDGNMQSNNTVDGITEAFFDGIRFDRVFDEGAFNPMTDSGREIIRCRCAEVLAPSPLLLEGTVQSVLCRSAGERATLLHHLGIEQAAWASRIRVVTEPGLFENRYTFVDTVDLTDMGIKFALHPRRDGAMVSVNVEVRYEHGAPIIMTGTHSLDPSKSPFENAPRTVEMHTAE